MSASDDYGPAQSTRTLASLAFVHSAQETLTRYATYSHSLPDVEEGPETGTGSSSTVSYSVLFSSPSPTVSGTDILLNARPSGEGV